MKCLDDGLLTLTACKF